MLCFGIPIAINISHIHLLDCWFFESGIFLGTHLLVGVFCKIAWIYEARLLFYFFVFFGKGVKL